MIDDAVQPQCTVPWCENQTPAWVCMACIEALAVDLAAIPEVLADLMITMTRQDVGRSLPGVARERPLAYRPDAAEVGRDLHAVLSTWVRHLLESRGLSWESQFPRAAPPPGVPVRRPGDPYGPLPPPRPHQPEGLYTVGEWRPAGPEHRLPSDDTIALAVWLGGHLESVRQDEAGGELCDELADAVGRARHATDRAGSRVYLGPCDCTLPGERQMDLYAAPHHDRSTCRACGKVWDVAERRARMLEQADDLLLTGEVATRALPGLIDEALTFETLRTLRRYHGLDWYEPHPDDPNKRPRYVVREIREALERARVAAEARQQRMAAARPPDDQLSPGLAALFASVRAAAKVNTTTQAVRDA